MKIVCVRIGDLYDSRYEEYIESKLPEHEIVWVREPMQPNINLQWNKLFGMTLDVDEPICVMDIDVLLINDYKKVFDYPIKRGQFLAAPGWWRDMPLEAKDRFTINGGFQKYYPKDVKYIYDKFMKQPEYWQTHYVKEGWASPPFYGEQHFIEDSVNEKLELVKLPNSWVTRFNEDLLYHLTLKYTQACGNLYLFNDDGFHKDLKFVHFAAKGNFPHKWNKYEQYK